MADEPFNASDPKAVQKAESAARLREQQRKAVVAQLLGSREGREWLAQILKDCHTFEERVTISGGQYEQGVFNGERRVGLDLMRFLAKSAPQNFALLLQENDI